MKNLLLPCVALALLGSFRPQHDAQSAVEPVAAPEARAAFERFKELVGDWSGASTAGWKDLARFEVIARGSVVMETSLFAAHPGETMVTMFHLDGERLLLTHYCVAGNQPRLVLTDVAENGHALTFSYLDGTGLASRDEGHMDKVVIHFDEDGSYRARWSWYQDGAESWMEDIRLERRR